MHFLVAWHKLIFTVLWFLSLCYRTTRAVIILHLSSYCFLCSIFVWDYEFRKYQSFQYSVCDCKEHCGYESLWSSSIFFFMVWLACYFLFYFYLVICHFFIFSNNLYFFHFLSFAICFQSVYNYVTLIWVIFFRIISIFFLFQILSVVVICFSCPVHFY